MGAVWEVAWVLASTYQTEMEEIKGCWRMFYL